MAKKLLKKKTGLKKKAAAPAKAAKASKKGKAPRGRVTQQDKIARRLKRAGKSTVNVKSAVYNVEITDLNAVTTYEGLLVADNGSHVVFRHKKSRGGSRMRVSHFQAEDIVSLYGDIGEAAAITVREAKSLLNCKGTVSYDKGVIVVTSDVTGEVTRIHNRSDLRVAISVDEESTARSASKKGAAKKRRAAKVDDEDFEDDE